MPMNMGMAAVLLYASEVCGILTLPATLLGMWADHAPPGADVA